MRTYGRDPDTGVWGIVETDSAGFNDAVYLTTLVQCLKLSPEESPFYSQYGIPATASVIQQIIPTYYVNQLQSFFQQYFSSLQIALTQTDPPVYNIAVITNSGSKILTEVRV